MRRGASIKPVYGILLFPKYNFPCPHKNKQIYDSIISYSIVPITIVYMKTNWFECTIVVVSINWKSVILLCSWIACNICNGWDGGSYDIWCNIELKFVRMQSCFGRICVSNYAIISRQMPANGLFGVRQLPKPIKITLMESGCTSYLV